MTVYVDDMRAEYRPPHAPHLRYIMCHMLADTDEELHAMADAIGVARRHHQAPPRHDSHYDITLARREQAVRRGAVEVTMRELAVMNAFRRRHGTLPTPEEALRWRKSRLKNKA